MKIGKKGLYLKRFIVIIMMAGYMALLALLLVISWYLIADYQEENRQKEMDTLESFVRQTEDAMYDIDRNVYDVYAYNDNFSRLSGVLPELETYQNVYELSETLRNKISIDENTHGYFLFYDRLSKARYRTNQDKLKADEPAQINDYLKRQVSVAGNMRNWSVFSVDDDTLLAITCRRDNVSLSAVHSLGNVGQELQQKLGKDLEVILINGEVVLQGHDLEKTLGLRNKISESLNTFSGTADGRQVYASRIEKTDLWVCMAIPYSIWNIVNVQQIVLLALTLLSALAVISLYSFLRKSFLQPLRELTGIMNQIRKGEMAEVPDINARFQELREVNETLTNMVNEIEKQKLLVYEEIIETQRAKMQYLQLQLKPHFYLNGLKTLNALAATGEREKIQEFIFSLSDHLRYLLQVENELVPLYKEVAFVKNYVNLQDKMTGREVYCQFNIDERAEQWQVPTLCVQSFVENSIKYARFGSSNVPLKISVTTDILSTEEGRFLDLTVSDNGQGYPLELLQVLNDKSSAGNKNVGINNLKRRGQILYGNKMEYRFINNEGAVSELIIPEEAEK